eukprot:m.130453 g.130453  ORF g.130453 m.130453 type:complete len:352 (-) comp29480_c0_seq1:37-1092(-)
MSSIGPALPPGFLKSRESSSTSHNVDDNGGPARPPSDTTVGTTSPPSTASVVGPTRPPSSTRSPSPPPTISLAIVGPSRPPSSSSNVGPIRPSVVGPSRPPTMTIGPTVGPARPDPSQLQQSTLPYDDYVSVGPMPIAASADDTEQAELRQKLYMIERRSLAQKKAIDNITNPTLDRDTWMTELPDLLRKDFGTEARTFRKRAAVVDADVSIWTDTPAEREKKRLQKAQGIAVDVAEINPAAQALADRDRKIDAMLQKQNKKHRSESLLELHQKKKAKKEKKKHKKDKKQKEKEAKKRGIKHIDTRPERVPFDRERDLDIGRSKKFGQQEKNEANSQLGSRFASSSDRKYL